MMVCFNSRLLLHESQKRSRTRRVPRSPRYSATQQLATDHFGATGHRIPYQRPFLRQNRLCQPASQKGLGLLEHQSTIQYTFAIQQPRPQHLPRGLAQRIFSQPPRLSTSRLPLPHGSPRRSAKNALLSENFLGDGRIFLGGRHAEPPGAILANENSEVLASLPSNLAVRRECRTASRLSLSLKST